MAPSLAQRFQPPAIPWQQPRALLPLENLGPGLDPVACGHALRRLCSEGPAIRPRPIPIYLAVIVRQPRLTPPQKAACWRRFRQAIGVLGVGVDLVVVGSDDADRLSQSRWHVLGDVARDGRVLYVAG